MTKHLQQCMGGWCTRREKCAHYWAKPTENVPPADRLCVNLTPEQEERERMATRTHGRRSSIRGLGRWSA